MLSLTGGMLSKPILQFRRERTLEVTLEELEGQKIKAAHITRLIANDRVEIGHRPVLNASISVSLKRMKCGRNEVGKIRIFASKSFRTVDGLEIEYTRVGCYG